MLHVHQMLINLTLNSEPNHKIFRSGRKCSCGTVCYKCAIKHVCGTLHVETAGPVPVGTYPSTRQMKSSGNGKVCWDWKKCLFKDGARLKW